MEAIRETPSEYIWKAIRKKKGRSREVIGKGKDYKEGGGRSEETILGYREAAARSRRANGLARGGIIGGQRGRGGRRRASGFNLKEQEKRTCRRRGETLSLSSRGQRQQSFRVKAPK